MAVISHEEVPALDASYRTIRVLAEGPGGMTELVRGPQGQVLVRKRIPLELANVHAWMTLTRIESPLLPKIDSLYELDGNLVVVLTYVDGVTLGEMVDSTGPLGAAESVRYLCELCEAVGVLHANGIVHRDLAPSNIVVAQGSARIIDLGNARVHSEGAPRDTTTLGTFGFAAPEQFGFAQTDARSDVYSLGSFLGYMLTGARPDDPGFDTALWDQSLVPANLRLVVQRSRSFEPSARYQTATELASAAWAASGGATVPQAPSALWPVAGTMAQRAYPVAGQERKLRPSELLRVALRVIPVWFFLAFLMGIIVDVCFDPTRHPETYEPITYPVIGVLGLIINVFMGWEYWRLVLRRGPYATDEDSPWSILAWRILVAIGIGFAITVVAHLVSTYLGHTG